MKSSQEKTIEEEGQEKGEEVSDYISRGSRAVEIKANYSGGNPNLAKKAREG